MTLEQHRLVIVGPGERDPDRVLKDLKCPWTITKSAQVLEIISI